MSGFAERIVGLQLGAYQVRRLVARGGMGIVYEGLQLSLNRVVAIKVLYPHLSDDPAFVERFQREAHAVAQLNHPNIVRVIDYGSDQGYYFMVMDFITGGSLRDALVDAHGNPVRLPVPDALRILTQVGAALTWAHLRGYVHRDVKPGNILLDADGNAALSDFGLVKMLDAGGLTMTGAIVGTPECMAQEQSDPTRVVGPAADQYSLAVVAYELLAGRVPFTAATPVGLLHQHLHEAPPSPRSFDPTLPAAVDAVLMRALAKEPEARYPSADEFVQALIQAMGSAATGSVTNPAGNREAETTQPFVPEAPVALAPADAAPTPEAHPIATSTSAAPGDVRRMTASGHRQRVSPVLVAIVLAALVGIGAVAWFALAAGDDTDPNPTQTPVSAVAGATATSLVTPDAATATVATQSTDSSPATGDEQLVSDDFSDPTISPFSTFDSDASAARYVDGEYEIEVFGDGEMVWFEASSAEFPAGHATTTLTIDGDGRAGFATRVHQTEAGATSVHACWVAPDGEAACELLVDDGWETLMSRTLDIDPADSTTLEVEIDGSELHFWVNGELVDTATVAEDASGHWGVFVANLGDDTVASFDDFELIRFGD